MLLHRPGRTRTTAESDVRDYPRWLDRLFAAALAVERAMIATGISLPFGGSLIIVAARDAEAPALSIVVPVYNGAATVGELVQALRGLGDRRRPGDRAGRRLQPGQQPGRLQAARRRAGRAGHRAEPQPQFGEHNAVMAGFRARAAPTPSPWTTICRTAIRGEAPVRARARRRLRRGLHLLRGEAACGLAQLGQPLHQLVRRSADRQAARLYLSSFRCISAFVRERIVASYQGPYPYVDGLVFQVTQNVGRLQVGHLPRIEGRSNYTLRRLVRYGSRCSSISR